MIVGFIYKAVAVLVGKGQRVSEPGLHPISKHALSHHLHRGSYSIMTAANPHAKRLSNSDNQKRMERLRKELDKRGAIYHEVRGHYGGNTEPAFMIHHVNIKPEDVEKLGKKFGQESVLHSFKSKHKLVYTAGEHEGKHHTGEGFTMHPHKSAFTHIPHAGKFSLKLKFGRLYKALLKIKKFAKRHYDYVTVKTHDHGWMQVRHAIDRQTLHGGDDNADTMS